MGRIGRAAFLVLAVAAPALAEEPAAANLLDRCWTPQALAAAPGEKLIALTFDLCEADGTVAGYDGRIVICCAPRR